MRTIDANITTAVTAKTSRPAISVVLTDTINHYPQYQNTALNEGWSDAYVNSNNTIYRASMSRSAGAWTATLSEQQITDPGSATQWSTWSIFGNANMFRDAGCAIGKLTDGNFYVVAQQGNSPTFTPVYWKSPDGSNWTGPFSLPTLPVAGAAIRGFAIDNNTAIWCLYDDGAGHENVAVSNGAGAFNPWVNIITGLAGGNGLSVVVAGGNDYIALSDGVNILAYVLVGGITLTAYPIISPADSGTGVVRLYPRMQVYDGLFNIAYVEQDLGTVTGLTYALPRYRQSLDFQHWTDGVLANGTCNYSVVPMKIGTPPAGTAGARYLLAGSTLIFSSPVAKPTMDVTANILSYKRADKINGPGEIEIVLSNYRGQYNNLMGGALGLNSTITIQEGYYVGSPGVKDLIPTATYRVTSYHFVRNPFANVLHIKGKDALYMLDREMRNTFTYTNLNIVFMSEEIATRGGILTLSLPGTSQMSSVYPNFVTIAGSKYKAALDEISATYGLTYFLDQTEKLIIRELSGSDASIWTYQVEWEDLTASTTANHANHILISGKPPSTTQLTVGESYDWPYMQQLGFEHILHKTDYKLDTGAKAASKATFMLTDEQRSGMEYSITIPINPALQLCDVITLIDSQINQNGPARIVENNITVDFETGVFQQVLALESV